MINYDLPLNKENYLYRMGHLGVFGRKGTAINFVTPRDADMLKEIQDFYKTQVDQLPEGLGELNI